MKNNRRQAQFLLRSITDDVPQLLLEENNLFFRNELKNAQFKKIVALSNLIQRIYHNDIRNMLP